MTRLMRILGSVAVVLALAAPAAGQGALAPIGVQLHDNNGDPCNLCVLYSFAAGTTTPLATYADAALSTSNGTSVTLDASGRANIFLSSALAYKLTLRTAAGVDIWTRDGIVGPLSGVITAQAANTRGIQVSRSGADAGISIASTGGSGLTWGLVSGTDGGFTIRDDGDGTPNTKWLGNNITHTLTGTFSIPTGLVSIGGFGTHAVSSAGTGGNIFGVRNTTAGTGNYAQFSIGNDASATAGRLFMTSSTFTPSGASLADAVVLEGARAGGVSINASNAAGAIRFYAGGTTTPALTISSSGITTIGGMVSVASSPGIGANHDYALGAASIIIYQSGIGSSNITGFAGGQNGRQLWVVCSPGASGSLTLDHEDAGSTAANRITSVTGADIVVTSSKAVQLVYDGTTERWLAFDVK